MSDRHATPFSFNLASSGARESEAGVTHELILLIEDEPRLLRSQQLLLTKHGYKSVTARCGLQAIEHLEKTRFDLVILDLGLPDIGGHDIMDFMRLHQLDAHVVVISGVPEIEAVIGALKRGAHDYLRKPYANEELLNTVEKALQHRRLQIENRRIAAQLENSERIYRNLVDCSPDIIYTLDQSGHFTFVNNRARELLGLDPGELLGRHYSALIHDADIERANYVFNEGRDDHRLTRRVELRFKSRHNDSGSRAFSNELMKIALSSTRQSTPENAAAKDRSGIYGVARDITDHQQADELIAHQAYHDILTNLPNRLLFKDRLNLAMLQARRNESNLAIMFIDLDRFKLVNDAMGHAIGDELLQQTALRLKTCLRRCDTLARLGDDEFTVILPELADQRDAALIANKFLAAMRPPFDLGGQSIHMTASVGIAFYPDNGTSIDELIRHAGIAMYHIKAGGKNGHAFFEKKMLEASNQKISLERSLHLAQELGELQMHYQPQVDVRTGTIIGAEALMRWNHPGRGLLSAGEFLPLAEDNGLIIPISDWMLEAICQDLLAWNAIVGESIRLSLNLSPQYLDRGDFFEKLHRALSHHRISPQQIEVEVTENICIRNPQAAIRQLDKLCQLGVSVAIDDFGTGYSSLSYLHRFPIHTIKIDRSFIMEIQSDAGQFPVVLAIISIAKGLGLNLIAEGVETPAQAAYLENSGCHVMQGYLYHKPMSQAAFLSLLETQIGPFCPLLPPSAPA